MDSISVFWKTPRAQSMISLVYYLLIPQYIPTAYIYSMAAGLLSRWIILTLLIKSYRSWVKIA